MVQSLSVRCNYIALQRIVAAISGIEFHSRLGLAQGSDGKGES
jgi:hypothetical protein